MTFNSRLQMLSGVLGGHREIKIVENVVNLPAQAIEETRTSYGMWRGFVSSHTRDLRLVFFVISVTVIVILISQLYFGRIIQSGSGGLNQAGWRDPGNSYLPLFIPMAVSVVIGALLTVFQIGKKRFATVDLFSMEMLSIVRLIAISDIIAISSMFLNARDNGVSPEEREEILEKLSAGLSIYGEDNFSEVFVKNTSELGWLDAKVVDYTTGYYTFIRSLHNLTDSFKVKLDNKSNDVSDEVIMKYIEDICYVIDTAMDNAYRAFDGLIQSRLNRRSAQQSALLVGTRANNLLLFHLLSPSDGKYTTASRRNLVYQSMIKRM